MKKPTASVSINMLWPTLFLAALKLTVWPALSWWWVFAPAVFVFGFVGIVFAFVLSIFAFFCGLMLLVMVCAVPVVIVQAYRKD